MRIKGDYLRKSLPALLDKWADDVDRLDIRIQPDDEMDAGNEDRYELPHSVGFDSGFHAQAG
ncbi:hypothetical protein [Methylocaldum sp.]|uniref:hypothetical protein n=1 Tax=Methylocaldum sp. TaxID=1969727 RepID=UPI002D668CF8|nr:hypothetical protein [Methylocaldum sp.]HYE37001.1 hypothetical protein [Methylocaldum sp.]